VAHDASGAPYFASDHPALAGNCADGRIAVALSISHSNGYAFCALCENDSGEVRVGVDLELVAARHESFAQEFFTAAEQARVNTAPSPMRDLLLTAGWSAKEAVLKAAQLGLRADPRTVECFIPLARPRHWLPVGVEMQPVRHAQAQAAGPLRLWWRVIENRLLPGSEFVLTLAAYGASL
jgi:phosphopantetheinyl transferase (holo-ACP synthase)